MAIVYALCCLGFAAVNDFLFKLFANGSEGSGERRSCGRFVMLVGVVDALFMASLLRGMPERMGATLLWGVVSGGLSVASNILVIESMRHQSAGVSSTIFRLNLVLVVVGGCALFGEPVSVRLALGALCAGAAIVAFLPPRSGGARSRRGFLMALAACVLRAAMSLSDHYAFRHGADLNAVTTLNGLCWVLGGLAFAVWQERRLAPFDRQELRLGLLSGAFVCGIIFFMARMNACGDASVVNPIAQMSFLGTFILSAVFLRRQETVTPRKLAALALGALAIALLAA